MTTKSIKSMAAVAGILVMSTAPLQAEDTDLFLGTSSSAATGSANVLIILDNSANWTSAWPGLPQKQGWYELEALKTAIQNLGPSFRVGLMEGTTTEMRGYSGGFVRFAMQSMTVDNKEKLTTLLTEMQTNISAPTEKTDQNFYWGNLLFEAYKYFGGYSSSAISGWAQGTPTDYAHYGACRFAGSTTTSSGANLVGNSAEDAGVKLDIAAFSGNSCTTAIPNPSNSPQSNYLSYVPASISDPAACVGGKNYIIFVGNTMPSISDEGLSMNNTSMTDRGNVYPAAVGGRSAPLSISPTNSSRCITGGANDSWCKSWADEWAHFLFNSADVRSEADQQNVITYVINVYAPSSPSTNMTHLLKSMAYYGSGGTGTNYNPGASSTPPPNYYEASSASALDLALSDITSKIQAINSTFASASLPVSVNTQGTYLNQVLIGMFRPDTDGYPRWKGNLKQYQMALSGSTLNLVDAVGHSAINTDPNTGYGFVDACAQSYWTFDMGSIWQSTNGSCTSADKTKDLPDGEVVEKGGVAEHLRKMATTGGLDGTTSPSPRKNLTTTSSLASREASLPHFNATNTTLSATLVEWVRGGDTSTTGTDSVALGSGSTTGNTDIRLDIHGDVVHSRPLAIDYGTRALGTSGVVAFYGSNDGWFHAIKAGKATNDSTNGNELWAFIAPEHWSQLARLKENSPLIRYPGMNVTGVTPTPLPKDYFFDGSIGAYTEASAGAVNKAWIYPSMRRGGRMLYAFNVTDPDNPTLKWSNGCQTNIPAIDLSSPTASPSVTGIDGSCTSATAINGVNWTNIGQTWSQPVPMKAVGYVASGVAKPVLLVGGGYDTCEDAQNFTGPCRSPQKGAFVMAIDADNGTLLNAWPTSASVVGNVTPVDSDFNGYADFAYAVDTVGNVYRLTIGSGAPSTWTLTPIAKLGCAGTGIAGGANALCSSASAMADHRKFLFAPEVAVSYDSSSNLVLNVLVGSGDREHPLADSNAANVSNAFFKLEDKPAVASWLDEACGEDKDYLCLSSLTSISPDCTTDCTQDAAAKGWYMTMHNKEQVVTNAIVVEGNVYFSTHAPVSSATYSNNCRDLGTARAYAVAVSDASIRAGDTSRYAEVAGGGLPPSPVAGVVNVGTDADPQYVPFILGGKQYGNTPSSALESQYATGTDSINRYRVYWYLEQ